MNGQHSKKLMCLYFNFCELGFATLAEGATWICPLVIPTEIESTVEGGWSGILADFLERFFFGSHGFLTAGVPISDGTQMFLLYATLGVLISDGDGIRKATGWRGAASMRPCMKHSNVLKKNTGLLDILPPGWYDVSHHVHSDFHVRSTAEWFDSADKIQAAHASLEAGTLTMTLFNDICQAEGMNYHPRALPWRTTLRGTIDWYACFSYDWAHTMLQDGPLNVELFQYLQVCKEYVPFPRVQEWLSMQWIFPGGGNNKGKLLWRIFSDWRKPEGKDWVKLKCSCSELLGVYALVRLLCELKVPDAPERAAHKESFLLCCTLVDIIKAAKQRTCSMLQAADLLEDAFRRYMLKHREAYGDTHIRPKFHWMFDIIEQFRRWGMVHDQFIVERLHLWIKNPAERCDNLRRWERSVLAMALNHQVQDLRLLKGPCHIMDRTVMRSPMYPNAAFSNNIRVMGMRLSIRDVLFWRDRAGEVQICAKEEDSFFVVLDVWEKISEWTSHASTWRTRGLRREVVDAREVEVACAWAKLSSGDFLVVRH